MSKKIKRKFADLATLKGIITYEEEKSMQYGFSFKLSICYIEAISGGK